MQIKQAIQIAQRSGSLMENETGRKQSIAYQFNGYTHIRALMNLNGEVLEGVWEDVSKCRLLSVRDLLEEWSLISLKEFTGRNKPH